MEQKTYKLGGLLMLFISLLLSFAGSIASGVLSGINAAKNPVSDLSEISSLSQSMSQSGPIASIISIVISIAVLILTIAGIAKLRKQNKRFKLGFSLMILTIVLMVIAIIACVIFIAVGINSMEGEVVPETLFLIILVPMAAFLIVMIISLIQQWAMLAGCKMTAEDCGEPEFGKKVRGTWRLYLISFIIGLVGLILTGLFIYLTISRMTPAELAKLENIKTIDDLSAFAILLIPLAVFVVAGIIGLIAQIMVMVRYIQTYSKFNGRTIGGEPEYVPEYAPEIEVSDEII